jgi:hypothetical protein
MTTALACEHAHPLRKRTPCVSAPPCAPGPPQIRVPALARGNLIPFLPLSDSRLTQTFEVPMRWRTEGSPDTFLLFSFSLPLIFYELEIFRGSVGHYI